MAKITLMISKGHGVVKEANIHHCFEVIFVGDPIFYSMGDNENLNTTMMSYIWDTLLVSIFTKWA